MMKRVRTIAARRRAMARVRTLLAPTASLASTISRCVRIAALVWLRSWRVVWVVALGLVSLLWRALRVVLWHLAVLHHHEELWVLGEHLHALLLLFLFALFALLAFLSALALLVLEFFDLGPVRKERLVSQQTF